MMRFRARGTHGARGPQDTAGPARVPVGSAVPCGGAGPGPPTEPVRGCGPGHDPGRNRTLGGGRPYFLMSIERWTRAHVRHNDH